MSGYLPSPARYSRLASQQRQPRQVGDCPWRHSRRSDGLDLRWTYRRGSCRRAGQSGMGDGCRSFAWACSRSVPVVATGTLRKGVVKGALRSLAEELGLVHIPLLVLRCSALRSVTGFLFWEGGERRNFASRGELGGTSLVATPVEAARKKMMGPTLPLKSKWGVHALKRALNLVEALVTFRRQPQVIGYIVIRILVNKILSQYRACSSASRPSCVRAAAGFKYGRKPRILFFKLRKKRVAIFTL